MKSLFGYAPEDPDLYPFLTAREYLQMIADVRKTEAASQIESLLTNLHLTEVADDLIDRYSHGMRQKISFAAALIGNPPNLVCDEALNGFDPIATFYVKQMLRDLAVQGHMVLLSSHVLELLENWCDEIIIIHQGQIIARHTLTQIEEIRENTGKSFQEYFVNLISDQSR